MDPWCLASDVKARPDMGTLTDDQATLAAEVATFLLNALTGRQFGITMTTTVRPVGCGHCDLGPPSQYAVVGWGLPLLAREFGPWPLPGPEGGMAALCGGCGEWSFWGVEITGPVVWDDAHPVTLTVDGDVIDPSDWEFIDRHRIVRTDGGVIPRCQSLLLADTEVGTCSITYSRGVAVPEAGKQACISLAVQLAFFYGYIDGECILPGRVINIVRQGVQMKLVDSLDILKQGGTGLTDADAFIAAVNPCGLRRRARIYSPGMPNSLPTVFSGSAGSFS